MYLYLSGAKYPNSEQNDVRASLGGNISISTVPNNEVNAIFDDITSYGKSKRKKDVKTFFFRNDNEECIENLTLTQIYSNEFGKESKLVKYQFGIVATNDNVTMQKVNNSQSEPFGVEFFEPSAKREFLVAEVLVAGKAGDVLELLGRTVLLTSNDKFGNVLDIVNSFEDDEEFKVKIKDDVSFYVERINLIQTNNQLEVLTPGNFKIKDVSFSGFFDNSVLVIEKLNPGEVIGVWIQRETLPSVKTECSKLEKQYDEYFGKDFSEEVLLTEMEKEESLEIIWDWD